MRINILAIVVLAFLVASCYTVGGFDPVSLELDNEELAVYFCNNVNQAGMCLDLSVAVRQGNNYTLPYKFTGITENPIVQADHIVLGNNFASVVVDNADDVYVFVLNRDGDQVVLNELVLTQSIPDITKILMAPVNGIDNKFLLAIETKDLIFAFVETDVISPIVLSEDRPLDSFNTDWDGLAVAVLGCLDGNSATLNLRYNEFGFEQLDATLTVQQFCAVPDSTQLEVIQGANYIIVSFVEDMFGNLALLPETPATMDSGSRMVMMPTKKREPIRVRQLTTRTKRMTDSNFLKFRDDSRMVKQIKFSVDAMASPPQLIVSTDQCMEDKCYIEGYLVDFDTDNFVLSFNQTEAGEDLRLGSVDSADLGFDRFKIGELYTLFRYDDLCPQQ